MRQALAFACIALFSTKQAHIIACFRALFYKKQNFKCKFSVLSGEISSFWRKIPLTDIIAILWLLLFRFYGIIYHTKDRLQPKTLQKKVKT